MYVCMYFVAVRLWWGLEDFWLQKWGLAGTWLGNTVLERQLGKSLISEPQVDD